MKKVRQVLIVYVDLDPVPGAMHTKESARNIVDGALKLMMPHYNPMVSIAPANLEDIVDKGTN